MCDPVFGLPTPIVFAHRGGAGEVPESTELAFRHALDVGSDVLELDLQLTRDGVPVVWHGPELDIVYGASDRLLSADIREQCWSQLEGKAWVRDPRDLDGRVRTPERSLLSLESFVHVASALEDRSAEPRRRPWNIELKSGAGWDGGVTRVLDLLAVEARRRKILLAVAMGSNVKRLRRALERHPDGAAFATNLAFGAQVIDRFARLGRLVGLQGKRLDGVAVQTSYAGISAALVADLHRRGAAVHPFLTGFFPIPGIDGRDVKPLRRRVEALLSAGVDGLMTDYPQKVVPLVRDWVKTHGGPRPCS